MLCLIPSLIELASHPNSNVAIVGHRHIVIYHRTSWTPCHLYPPGVYLFYWHWTITANYHLPF